MSRTILDIIGQGESKELGGFEEGVLRRLGDEVDKFRSGQTGDESEANFIDRIVREIEHDVKSLEREDLDNIRRSLGYKI